MSKTLLILAHPNFEKSEINSALIKNLPKDNNLTFYDLYKENPNFKFNVEKEQKLLVEHDHIILQFPFHWYSATPLLRLWFDEVLTHGFAYAVNGKSLSGKKLSCIITTGGPSDAYQRNGYNYFTIEELIKPFVQTAKLTSMLWQEPFLVQGSKTITKNELEQKSLEYKNYILESLKK